MSLTLPRRGCLEQMFTPLLNLRQSPLPLCTFELVESFEQITDFYLSFMLRVFVDLLLCTCSFVLLTKIQPCERSNTINFAASKTQGYVFFKCSTFQMKILRTARQAMVVSLQSKMGIHTGSVLQ